MKALIGLTGQVIDIAEAPFPVADGLVWTEAPAGVQRGWERQENGTLSPPPSGPPKTLSERKRDKRIEVTSARENALRTLRVEFDGAYFEGDETSVLRMSTAISAWERAVKRADPRAPQVIEWLDADNVPRSLTLSQLIELADRVWLAQQQVWTVNHMLKVQVEKGNAEEVEGVKWP